MIYVSDFTLALQKLRMLLVDPAIGEIRGVKGEAVVNYREPLTTHQRRINSGDAVASTFQKGRKHDKMNGFTWNSHSLISRNSLKLQQEPCYYGFLEPLVMFFMQR